MANYLAVAPLCLVAASVLALTGCASAPNSKETVGKTRKDWASDAYIVPVDERTAALNSARVLSKPEAKVDGRVMQAGSIVVIVHARPDVMSKPVGRLQFGDAVRVLAEADYIRLPKTGTMSEYAGKEGEVAPTWCRIRAGDVEGWVPARSLAQPLDLATSSEALAASRAKSAADGSGKGFSEKVKREAKAMKGAAGTPVAKDANYEAADKVLARAQSPVLVSEGASPFSPQPRASDVPRVGKPLAEVDAGIAAEVARKTESAGKPSDFGKALDGARGLLGAVGFEQANDPAVRIGVEAAKLAEVLTKESPVTVVEERVLGRECLAMSLGTDTVLPPTDPISAYVSWVGARVAALSSSPYPACGLEFVVVDDRDTVNAMAMPGGIVLVTTGMLGFLESEHELAAILGHEATHVEERHGLKLGMQNGMEKWPSVLAFFESVSDGVLVPTLQQQVIEAGLPEDLAKPVVQAAIDIASAEAQKAFTEAIESVNAGIQKGADQGVETAADLRGMSLCCSGGWDPSALGSILARLKQASGSYGGASYSETRSADADAVVGLLPCASEATAPEHGSATAPTDESAKRWRRLDELLAR